jgi:hypothetical protein
MLSRGINGGAPMFFLLSFILSVQVFAISNSTCTQVASQLHEGDLIFLDMDSVIFEQVAVATLTWTSHVGVAVYEEGWYVAESALLKSRKISLCKYLSRAQAERFEVRRLKQYLSVSALYNLKDYLDSQMGIFYDTGFNYDSAQLFCSKLVYHAFQNIGITVGEIKTFKQVFAENPEGSLTFWQVWFLGSIPWDRRTVTPKDQLVDDDFFTVLSSGIRN